MSTTEIVVFDGFDELDVVAPFEILVSAGYPVALVTMEPCQSVTGWQGAAALPVSAPGAC
jgi:putative intracellular protease/amidase